MNRTFFRAIIFSLLLHGALLAALLWWAQQTPWLGSGGDLDQGRIPMLMVRPRGGSEEGEVNISKEASGWVAPREGLPMARRPQAEHQRKARGDRTPQRVSSVFSQSIGSVGISGNGEEGNSSNDSGQSILSLIESRLASVKHYPPLARRHNIEGRVDVQFSIESDGTPADVGIASSSGASILDQEAIATVNRAAPLPYYPHRLTVPIIFELR